jgi:hypothetical protein
MGWPRSSDHCLLTLQCLKVVNVVGNAAYTFPTASLSRFHAFLHLSRTVVVQHLIQEVSGSDLSIHSLLLNLPSSAV